MSGISPSQIRQKTRAVLESMRGAYNVWRLDITEVRKRDSNFVIVGKFSETILATEWIPFTITIDEDGNVIAARLGE